MLRLSSLLILVASLFWGCIPIGFFFDEDNVVKCGEETYTAVNQICEDGIVKSQCGSVYYDLKIRFCYDNEIFKRCGGNSYNPSNQKCKNDIVLNKCGNDYYNSEMQFCFKNAIYDKCGYKTYNAETHVCKDGNLFPKCGDEYFEPALEYCFNNAVRNKEELIDSRDGKIYKYVVIGSQTWMAENLRYRTSNAICYENYDRLCSTAGEFYDWNTAKTICPSGWHLPSDAEWNTLRNFAGGDSAGTRLKANERPYAYDTGTDNFGFTALSSGYYGYSSSKRDTWITGPTVFWSATASSVEGSAHYYLISSSLHLDEFLNSNRLNIRCIKD